MTQRRGADAERRLGDRERHVDVTTERTGEGEVYRTEPRVVVEPTNVIDRQTTVTPFKDQGNRT